MPITWSQISARLGLPRPSYSDTPIDLVDLFNQRDAIVDLLASIDSGTLASRPASTPGSPGKKRRLYLTEGQPDSPRLDLDYGTGWVTLGPDPASKTYFEVSCTGPPGLQIPNGGNLILPFNTEISDANNLFDNRAGHYKYTVPSAGVYYFSARVALSYPVTGGTDTRFNATTPNSWGLQGALIISANDVDKLSEYTQIGVGDNSYFTWSVSGTFFCSAGDLIYAYASNFGNEALNVGGGLQISRFSGARIS